MLCCMIIVSALCIGAHAEGISVGVLIDTSKNLTVLNISASNSSILSNSSMDPLVEVVGVMSCPNPPCPDLTLTQMGTQLMETLFKPPAPNATITLAGDDNLWTRLYSSNDHMNIILIGGGLVLLGVFVGVACCIQGHTTRQSRVRGFTRPTYRKVLAVQLVRAV